MTLDWTAILTASVTAILTGFASLQVAKYKKKGSVVDSLLNSSSRLRDDIEKELERRDKLHNEQVTTLNSKIEYYQSEVARLYAQIGESDRKCRESLEEMRMRIVVLETELKIKSGK